MNIETRLKDKVFNHMLGYVDEELQNGNDIHDLGYLDSDHWIDAIKRLEPHLLPYLKLLAQRVDNHYHTNFHKNIEDNSK